MTYDERKREVLENLAHALFSSDEPISKLIDQALAQLKEIEA